MENNALVPPIRDQSGCMENTATASLEMSKTNDGQNANNIVEDQQAPGVVHEHSSADNIMEVQQLDAFQLNPQHRIIHVQDRISDIVSLDRKIAQTKAAYYKLNNNIYKFFLSFYGIMQVGILTATFSAQQRNGLCRDSWGLLVLSAIVSGGVLIASVQKYREQFRLLKRRGLLIEKRSSLVGHPSRISEIDLKEEGDLDIISGYWGWIAEKSAFVVTFITFSVCLWFTCKSRLLC